MSYLEKIQAESQTVFDNAVPDGEEPLSGEESKKESANNSRGSHQQSEKEQWVDLAGVAE